MPLDFELTPIEARVVGSLVEKELTTPEYYPLSINALTLACNQKSNREPSMSLTEQEVLAALDSLKSKQMVWQRSVAGARAVKYDHNLVGRWKFAPDEIALLCVLLLRGPQTVGELRTRTERMHSFASPETVESALQNLVSRDQGPFVKKLQRLPGHKENRYDHLFCGEREQSLLPGIEGSLPDRPLSPSAPSRIDALETQVQELKEEMVSLKTQFMEFKQQFE